VVTYTTGKLKGHTEHAAVGSYGMGVASLISESGGAH